MAPYRSKRGTITQAVCSAIVQGQTGITGSTQAFDYANVCVNINLRLSDKYVAQVTWV